MGAQAMLQSLHTKFVSSPHQAMPAMPTCARCGSTQHTFSQCPIPFYRKFCPKCNNTCGEVQRGAPICISVKAQKHEEWKEKDAAYQGLQVAKQVLREKKKVQSGSDASSDGASTCAETVDAVDSCRGRLALSPQEEREARKMERKLQDIARLQLKLDAGVILDKLQREKIPSKDALESHLVMQKIRAGAHRPSV